MNPIEIVQTFRKYILNFSWGGASGCHFVGRSGVELKPELA